LAGNPPDSQAYDAGIALYLRFGILRPGEDLYIHIALLFLVPVSTIGMFLAAFGYAYYQTCKRNRKAPFWEGW
jgi:hypothetical protein